jgi:L-ascorbate metabolism protein UlaG (beta-lactamase superfamily)
VMDNMAEIQPLGGPTVLLQLGGLRLLTDPTFDPPGEYPIPGGLVLRKTSPAGSTPADVGRIDAVLLSHDEHPDNLDHSGRAFLSTVPAIFTTPSGAGRLGGTARGLTAWASHELPRPDGGTLTITAVPARHGPEGCEAIAGEVTGFVLTAPDLPTVYISGDNAALELVAEIAERFDPIDTAVLFAGASRLPVFDGAPLTLTSADAAEATRILGVRRVVVAHVDSWEQISEGPDQIVAAFTAAGLADRLAPVSPPA